jgi:glycosyltransferase involved in cell wall biosynthesis
MLATKSVDVVVPIFNEELCLMELHQRLLAVMEQENQYAFRILLIENGSNDRSWSYVKSFSESDPRFVAVQLSRNFRMDGALTAGLEFATADAVVFMASDLQDPPENISDFLREWEKGFESVYGVVTERRGTSLLRRFNSRAFYSVAAKLTGGAFPENVSDFRLMDKKLYEVVRRLDERNRFLRGLVAWPGFSSIGVEIARPERFAGESKAHSLPVFGFAARALMAYSHVPLHLIALFGVALSVMSFMAFVPFLIVWLTRGVPFAGFGSLITLGLFSFGLLTLMLGVIAEYLSLIYEEVKRRPNFVVRQTIGI